MSSHRTAPKQTPPLSSQPFAPPPQDERDICIRWLRQRSAARSASWLDPDGGGNEPTSSRPGRDETDNFAQHRLVPAPPGTMRNAPDQIRTGDLRLERPTLFGPPEGPVDH